VNEHSTCAMGRAGTAVADPCPDGSAIFFNPAGLTQIGAGRTVLTVGGTFIAPRGGFTGDATGQTTDLKDAVYPVPNVYLVHGFSDRVGAGIGLFAPYGLTTEWPTNSVARYLGYKSVIRNIYVQPTVSARIGDYLSVGGGFDLSFLHVNLRQRLDLAPLQLPAPAPPGATFANLGIPYGTDFGDANVSGNATGVGYHLGVLFKLGDELGFGVRYLSRQKIKVDNGNVAFTPVNTGIILAAGNPFGLPPGTPLDAVVASQFASGGLLSDQGARTALRMPEQWAFGLAIKPADKLELLGEVTLQHWVVFDTLQIIFKIAPTETLPLNNKNTTTWRFGGEYTLSPATVLRAGILFHNAAEPSTSVIPNLPEGKRTEFTGGIGTRLGAGVHVDLAYQYIAQQDRRGRTTPFGTPNNGLYKFHAHLFGASLSYAF
ncbi:MAG TPA: outer membrane protein transport protein, partial [Gemmatimonadales bacterium]|nr:outer membrane protein transport protein [Gemmatimonadales bacterium]